MSKAKSGSLYKQKGSQYFWIKYYIPGNPKPVRESTKKTDEGEAQAYLWKRLGEIATGKFVGLEPERLKVNTLFDMLEEEYVNNGRATLDTLKSRLQKNLRPFFGNLLASTVGTRQISAYITKRKSAKAKNATINREMEHLKRAFKIGFESEPQLVTRPLNVKKLVEDNVREGLLEHDQYLKIRAGLPEPYRTLFICAYHLGTRAGELMKVQWTEVDFDRKEIVLKRYNTKTKKPRVLPIYGDMESYLKMVQEVQNTSYPDCPWVFQRNGRKMIFDSDTWSSQMVKLGSPGLLFHDLRRTALTNMIEAGFSEKEAMEISGHRTDRTFRRYHIIRRHRIQTIGHGMEEFYKNLENQEKEGSTGIVPGIAKSVVTIQ